MKANRSVWALPLSLLLVATGIIFLFAQQTDPDPKRMEDIKAKAENGDASTQNALGDIFRTGAGVTKDMAEAGRWYRKAAEQGFAEAQFRLGVMYLLGDGIPQDTTEATKWNRRAAENGYAKAQYNLGVAYLNGQGVAQDYAEAKRWYLKAADQGFAQAQFNLGVMYEKGQGVAQDNAEATTWYRKSAAQGLAQAQYNLGTMYGQGRGVPLDYVEAYKWLNIAAAQGETLAINNRENFARYMTPSQIAEGQRLASEFKPRKAPHAGSSASGKDLADSSPAASGTGFFITEDGFLITNEHVVKDAMQVRLVASVGMIPARVVKVDAANDLALLKAEGNFALLPVAASRAVRFGATVATVGFPNIGLQGFAPKLELVPKAGKLGAVAVSALCAW